MSDTSIITYACRLGQRTLLCCGKLSLAPAAGGQIFVNGQNAQKPYIGTRLDVDGKASHTVFILSFENGDALEKLDSVQLVQGDNAIEWAAPGTILLSQSAGKFATFLNWMKPHNLRKVLFLFYKILDVHPELAGDPLFANLCYQAAQHSPPSAAKTHGSQWVLPNVLTIEASLPVLKYPEKAFLVFQNGKQLFTSRLVIHRLQSRQDDSGEHYLSLLVALCPGDIRNFLSPKTEVTLVAGEQILRLHQIIPTSTDTSGNLAALVHYMPNALRPLVQRLLASTLLTMRNHLENAVLSDSLSTLQQFLSLPHTSVTDPHQPFGVNCEYCLPIGNQGFVVSGWIRDPLGMLQRVTLLTDLGHQLDITAALTFFSRSEVADLYPETRETGGYKGFAGYITLNEQQQEAINEVATLHGAQLRLSLRGDIHYTVTPPSHSKDPATLRSTLLTQIAPVSLEHPALFDAVSTAARTLHQRHIQRVMGDKVTVTHFGKMLQKPQASIIIPLYQMLDYIPAQLAHFVQDSFIRSHCEIIYILDSPEQTKTVKRQLKELSALLNIPVTLCIMPANGGYAAATHTGVLHSHGEYLCLMNSDILPLDHGWLESLLSVYDRRDKCGAIAPRLCYEDKSIQHAGMYFALDDEGKRYINKHYFKGYPEKFPDAHISREVPAVTGACLVISRAHYDAVDGYTMDYITGDYEDSDLCLKLRRQGLHAYYDADVVLQHSERQSMPQDHAMAWRMNTALHDTRWHKDIAQLMRKFDSGND